MHLPITAAAQTQLTNESARILSHSIYQPSLAHFYDWIWIFILDQNTWLDNHISLLHAQHFKNLKGVSLPLLILHGENDSLCQPAGRGDR